MWKYAVVVMSLTLVGLAFGVAEVEACSCVIGSGTPAGLSREEQSGHNQKSYREHVRKQFGEAYAIRMPGLVVAALKAHRTRQLKERLAAGGDWQDTALVFTTPIGTALDSRNSVRAFKAILKGAGLPDIRLHDLRRSCATLLLAQGVTPRVVQEVLGHSAITLTLRTYSHVLPALAEEAAAKLDAALTR